MTGAGRGKGQTGGDHLRYDCGYAQPASAGYPNLEGKEDRPFSEGAHYVLFTGEEGDFPKVSGLDLEGYVFKEYKEDQRGVWNKAVSVEEEKAKEAEEAMQGGG